MLYKVESSASLVPDHARDLLSFVTMLVLLEGWKDSLTYTH